MLRLPTEISSLSSFSSSSSNLTMVVPGTGTNPTGRSKKWKFQVLRVSALSYKKFVRFALEETKRHTVLTASPLQERFNTMTSTDGRTELEMLSFEAPKIRLLRSLNIENESMQVLDLTVFARPEFDVPIFCANIFTSASMNIIVLDLNPLHDVINQRDYREKYYDCLMPLGLKYNEISCSYFLGEDSLQTWLQLIDQVMEETDASKIRYNCEAQHRYLTWRAEKDPGYGVLKRLIGEKVAKDVVRNFLFNGIDELGSKKFLDYFPKYRSEDGRINEKRSVIGKSFENRPWNARGEFTGNNVIA